MAFSLPLAAAFAALLPSDPSLATAQNLAQLYKKAIATRDAAWFESTTTPDLEYVSIKRRKEDRAQALGELKAGFKAMKEDPKVTIRVLSAKKAQGGLLIVHDLTVTSKVEFGKPKPSILVFRMRQEVRFLHEGKAWRLKSIHVLRDTTTIDGKPISL